MVKFAKEFKAFISRGNIMDLAVAVIIGAAFKDIINSLVKDILSPVISLVVGEEGFTNYKYVITEANAAEGITENAIYYGNFIQSMLDFVIIALVVFLLIRFINKMKKSLEKTEEVVENVVEVVQEKTPKMEDILLDIKDLLTPGKVRNTDE